MFWNIFANLVNMLLLFIMTPIITNGLGDVGYGIYVILSTISGALSIINIGLGEATLRYVAYYFGKNDMSGVNRVFNATLCLYFVLGFFVTLFFNVFPNLIIDILKLGMLGDDAEWIIRLTMWTFFITFITGCFGSISEALQRYDISSYVNVSQNAVRFVLNIVIIFNGWGLSGLVLGNFILCVIYLIIQVIIGKTLLPFLKLFRFPNISDYKEIFSYGVWAFLGQLFGMIWQYCDNILLSVFLGPQFVGYFSIPMQIIGKVQGLISSGTNVLFPKFASEGDNKEVITALYIKSTQVSLMVSMLLFLPLCLLFKDFISLWISIDFAEKASFIAPILAFSYIIRGAFLPYEALLKGLGFPKYIMYITMASSLIILFLDVSLIPSLGLNGLGFAYVLSSLVGCVVIYLIWTRLIKQPIREAFRLLLFPYMVVVIVLGIFFILKNLFVPNEINIVFFIVESIIIISLSTFLVFSVYYFVDRHLVIEIKRNISNSLSRWR